MRTRAASIERRRVAIAPLALPSNYVSLDNCLRHRETPRTGLPVRCHAIRPPYEDHTNPASGFAHENLDLEGGRVSITQTLTVVGGYETQFSEPKTAKGRRMVALDPRTVSALKEHRAAQLVERSLMDGAYQDHDLVFAHGDGTPIHPESFSNAFGRHAEDAGLPRIRLHDLRHTHATLALQAGIHPKVVSERLGDASVTITLDTYSHALPAMQEAAASLVASLVFDG